VPRSMSQPRSAAKPPSLFELLSKLGRPEEGRWVLGVYPGAAEAGGCFVSAARPGLGSGGLAEDPETSAKQNSARARRSVRRYCAANRLNRLGTLTYRGSGCHDPVELRRDVGEFFRDLRGTVGGRRFPTYGPTSGILAATGSTFTSQRVGSSGGELWNGAGSMASSISSSSATSRPGAGHWPRRERPPST
jgi:hypothetical protein